MALRGLEGRSFIVTGGSDGVGLATVTRLVSEGARVLIVDNDEAAVASALDSVGSDHVHGTVADAASEEGTDRYFREATDRLGQIDGLFNNFGAGGPPTPIAQTTVEEFDRLTAGNLRSTFLSLRGLLRSAASQSRPAVAVTVSSGSVLRGIPGLGSFAAGKAGIIALTQAAAMEGAPSVRVNAIVPGPIETPALLADPPEFNEIILSRVPLARFGKADEAASLVAWLLSDESSYVTGASYILDGGEAIS